jgi:hypothetical protein
MGGYTMKKQVNFETREGSSLSIGEKIECYFNLHKGGFSIVSRDKRNPNNGKVVAYSPFVTIENATFHISLSKLEKIRQENKKTVYAVIRGIYTGHDAIDSSDYTQGYCNPFKTGMFVDFETGQQLEKASAVYFYDKFFSFKY